MMRKWILAILLLALLVVPVVADYSQNFQSYSAPNWYCIATGTGYCRVVPTAYPEDLEMTAVTGTGVQPGVYYGTPYPTNYYAWYGGQNGVGRTIILYDSFFNVLATIADASAGDAFNEIIRNSTTGGTTYYRNGVYTQNIGTLAIAPSYLRLNGGNSNYWDNFHTGESDPHYWTSTIPPNWTVVRDFMNPANSGLYAENTLIRATLMYSNWSRGNGTSYSTTSLRNVATGVTYETLGMSSRFFDGVANNLSILTAATSTAPNGLYSIRQDSGPAGYTNLAYFWLTSTGATIAWDMDKYYSDETSHITWSITPAYWDTTTYSYQGDIVNAYGTSKKSWAITAASGSETTTLDTTNYPQGVYFAKLTATQKASPFNSYILDTDNTEISQDIKISGITYNATTNSTFPRIFINFTQSGVGVVNTTSHATYATYNKTGFFPNLPIVIEPDNNIGSFQPLLWVPISFTPLSYGNFTINLYGTETLVNASKTHGNSTIYGLVQSSPYYNALPGATVRIWNATQYTSFYTNATGYYNFTGLLPFTEYNMNASYTGYTTSDDVVVNASTVFGGTLYNVTRKDFLLSTLYTMTITFKDATSGAVIPVVTVVDSNGYSATTTAGTFTYTYPYSLVAFYFSATGYTGSSSSYIMDSDRSETIYLTKSQTNVQNIWYTPWQVRIQIVDYYENPLVLTNVTAAYVASTLPSTSVSWLSSAFGISTDVANQMVSSGYAMGGQTDMNGGLSFTMFKSIEYNLSIVNTTSGVNVNQLLYPSDQEYRIRVPLSSQLYLNNTLQQMSATKLPIYQLSSTSYNLSVIYQDLSGLTTNLQFNCSFRNGTVIFGQNMGAPGTAVVANNCTVTDSTMGDEIVWWYNATRSGT